MQNDQTKPSLSSLSMDDRTPKNISLKWRMVKSQECEKAELLGSLVMIWILLGNRTSLWSGCWHSVLAGRQLGHDIRILSQSVSSPSLIFISGQQRSVNGLEEKVREQSGCREVGDSGSWLCGERVRIQDIRHQQQGSSRHRQEDSGEKCQGQYLNINLTILRLRYNTSFRLL